MNSIGEQIRDARNAKGWTQDTLAEKMQVTRSAVANWEQGRRMPDMATMVKLMAVLDCPLGDLSISPTGLEEAESEAAPAVSSDELPSVPDLDESPEMVDARVEGGAETDRRLEDSVTEADPGSRSEEHSDQHGDAGAVAGPAGSAQPAEAAPAASEKSTSVGSSAPSPKKSDKAPGRLSGKMFIPIAAAVLVALALLVRLVIFPALMPASKGIPYTSSDGEVYTMERMQQTAENVPGKAYLVVNPSLQINHGETEDYYIFEFRYHEMNGIALAVDRMEIVYFSKLKKNAFFINTAEDIKNQYGMTVDIPAYGDWSYVTGLPVQDTVYGVGALMHCTDENGEKLIFTSYLSFPAP